MRLDKYDYTTHIRECEYEGSIMTSEVQVLKPHVSINVRNVERSIAFYRQMLGIEPSKLIVTVDRHGNTSAASVPLALDLAIRDGRVKPGHKVMLEGVGGGFTWGASLVEM